MKIFYFTATGNSLYIAKRFGAQLYSIPQLLKTGNLEFEDEAVGFVFPCYGFDVPAPVKEFITKVKLKSRYNFAVITYGNSIADTSNVFVKFAAQNNIKIHYCQGLLMVDNVLTLFNLKKQKAADKKTEANLQRILEQVWERKYYIRNPNVILKLLTKALHYYLKRKPLSARVKEFAVNEKCNSCAACVKVCPKDNISLNEEKKPLYGDNCIFCLACINLCPQLAITLPGEKAKGERFINENITLKEIIDANI